MNIYRKYILVIIIFSTPLSSQAQIEMSPSAVLASSELGRYDSFDISHHGYMVGANSARGAVDYWDMTKGKLIWSIKSIPEIKNVLFTLQHRNILIESSLYLTEFKVNSPEDLEVRNLPSNIEPFSDRQSPFFLPNGVLLRPEYDSASFFDINTNNIFLKIPNAPNQYDSFWRSSKYFDKLFSGNREKSFIIHLKNLFYNSVVFLKDFQYATDAVFVNNDRELLVIGRSTQGSVGKIDASTGELIKVYDTEIPDRFNAFLSPQGTYALSNNILTHIEKGYTVATFPKANPPYRFSEDESMLVTGYNEDENQQPHTTYRAQYAVWDLNSLNAKVANWSQHE